MAEFKPLGQSLDINKRFAFEDGIAYRGFRQDMAPVVKHVEHLRHKMNEAPSAGNPRKWQHRGSIPMSVLMDFLHEETKLQGRIVGIDEWARNEDGLKDKFLKMFSGRDFSKLHNMHLTTKPESNTVTVPKDIARQASDVLIGE